MDKKTKLLIIGITMYPAGTEKSFLSFASCLDYDKYDVTLLLAKKEGLFLPMIPPQIRVIEMTDYAEMFTLNGGNAMKVIWNTMVKKNPKLLFEIFLIPVSYNPPKTIKNFSMEVSVSKKCLSNN